jgi:hypothetical protein
MVTVDSDAFTSALCNFRSNFVECGSSCFGGLAFGWSATSNVNSGSGGSELKFYGVKIVILVSFGF